MGTRNFNNQNDAKNSRHPMFLRIQYIYNSSPSVNEMNFEEFNEASDLSEPKEMKIEFQLNRFEYFQNYS